MGPRPVPSKSKKWGLTPSSKSQKVGALAQSCQSQKMGPRSVLSIGTCLAPSGQSQRWGSPRPVKLKESKKKGASSRLVKNLVKKWGLAPSCQSQNMRPRPVPSRSKKPILSSQKMRAHPVLSNSKRQKKGPRPALSKKWGLVPSCQVKHGASPSRQSRKSGPLSVPSKPKKWGFAPSCQSPKMRPHLI